MISGRGQAVCLEAILKNLSLLWRLELCSWLATKNVVDGIKIECFTPQNGVKVIKYLT